MASQNLPIAFTTAILLLEPMFAVLFAAIALQEIPSLWFGIGSILVCWGLRSIARADITVIQNICPSVQIGGTFYLWIDAGVCNVP